MKMLDELKAMCSTEELPDAQIFPTLYLDEEAQVGPALSGLMEYLGEDDTRPGVNLVIHGETAGFLPRKTLLASVDFAWKGLGDGDYAGLPGLPEYRLKPLRCPEPGCTSRSLVTYYRPADAPFCKVHPTRRMELAS